MQPAVVRRRAAGQVRIGTCLRSQLQFTTCLWIKDKKKRSERERERESARERESERERENERERERQ